MKKDFIAICCRTGIVIFVMVYIIATWYYPGGSDLDNSATGFDWLHNYWCELLAVRSKSGQLNAARPIAVGAFILLDVTLTLCWLQASKLFNSPLMRGIIVWSGVLSGIALCFLSSPSHDLVINIAGGFGLVALSCSLAGLWKKAMFRTFYLGLGCVLLFFLNTYIYYTGNWLYSLAVVQKVSFAAFLCWFWIVSGTPRPGSYYFFAE